MSAKSIPAYYANKRQRTPAGASTADWAADAAAAVAAAAGGRPVRTATMPPPPPVFRGEPAAAARRPAPDVQPKAKPADKAGMPVDSRPSAGPWDGNHGCRGSNDKKDGAAHPEKDDKGYPPKWYGGKYGAWDGKTHDSNKKWDDKKWDDSSKGDSKSGTTRSGTASRPTTVRLLPGVGVRAGDAGSIIAVVLVVVAVVALALALGVEQAPDIRAVHEVVVPHVLHGLAHAGRHPSAAVLERVRIVCPTLVDLDPELLTP